MEKISFTTKSLLDNSEIVGPVALDDKYLLLSYFIGHYRFKQDLDNNINRLDEILKGEKTFSDIQDPNVAWDFADGYCEFEVEGTTAYFTNHRNSNENIEMPLQEVVDYLKEWRAFLEKE